MLLLCSVVFFVAGRCFTSPALYCSCNLELVGLAFGSVYKLFFSFVSFSTSYLFRKHELYIASQFRKIHTWLTRSFIKILSFSSSLNPSKNDSHGNMVINSELGKLITSAFLGSLGLCSPGSSPSLRSGRHHHRITSHYLFTFKLCPAGEISPPPINNQNKASPVLTFPSPTSPQPQPCTCTTPHTNIAAHMLPDR